MARALLIVALLALLNATAGAARASELDPTFGEGGRVITSFAHGIPSLVPRSRYAVSGAAAVDGKGRIVLAGDVSPIPERGYIVLVRYLPDGRVDRSFGAAGWVRVPQAPGNTDVELSGLSIDGRERITVVYVVNPTAIESNYQSHWVVIVRYRPDGALDPSFGASGIAENRGYATSTQAAQYDAAVTLDASGRILLASSGNEPGVLRFTATGTLDQSFGWEGTPGLLPLSAIIRHTLIPYAIAADGDAVLIGGLSPSPGHRLRNLPFLAKITPEGAIDKSFANHGVLTFKGAHAVVAVALSAHHEILALLNTGRVFRIEPDGEIDRSFPKVKLPPVRGAVPGQAYAMNVDAQGRITLGGALGYPPRHPRDEGWRVLSHIDRFLPSGAQDPHFRPVVSRCGGQFSCGVNSIAPYPGGEIMTAEWRERIGGRGGEFFSVARYR